MGQFYFPSTILFLLPSIRKAYKPIGIFGFHCRKQAPKERYHNRIRRCKIIIEMLYKRFIKLHRSDIGLGVCVCHFIFIYISFRPYGAKRLLFISFFYYDFAPMGQFFYLPQFLFLLPSTRKADKPIGIFSFHCRK
jgi:hypothetical protein